MLNVTKIKELAKANGITVAFICKVLDKERSYLNGVAFRKADLPDADVEKIAEILHTSVAYLRDETDDPCKTEMTEKEKSIANIANALEGLPDEKLKELERLIYAFLGK